MKKTLILISFVLLFAGCACRPSVSVADGLVTYDRTPVGTILPASDAGVEYTDRIEYIDDNVLKITRVFTALHDIDSIRLSIDFRHDCECISAMIPSVCYDGNDWGRGKEPKGFSTDGVWHTYSYRRTPVPGATYSEGQDFTVAMWGAVPDCEDEAFSCSLMPEDAWVTHSLVFPEEERPFVYSNKDTYSAGYARRLTMRKGESRAFEAYLCVTPKEGSANPMAPFLDKAWALADKEYAGVFSPDKVWEYGIRYAKESLWAEENDYKGFSIGLVPYGEAGWEQRRAWKYEIGWCGQNA